MGGSKDAVSSATRGPNTNVSFHDYLFLCEVSEEIEIIND